jgi:uncharacterized protein (DUF1501 family)
MNTLTRRAVVRDGLMTVGASLLGGSVFGKLATEMLFATEQSTTPSNGNILVIVQLAGGNDGLNSIIPYTDPLYAQKRPTIGVPASQVIKLTDTLGLNPLLSAWKPLWDAGQMAVIENVGYPNSSLSHFQAMYIWQTLDMTGAQGTAQTGWLGSYLQQVGITSSQPFAGLDNSVALAEAFLAPHISVPTIGSAKTFAIAPDKANPGGSAQRTQHVIDYYQSFGQEDAANPFATFFTNVAATSVTATKQFATADTAYKPAVTYPNTPLAAGLQLVAAAITQKLGLRVGWVTLGGFDTHANEANTHKIIYPELAEATGAFWQDLTAQNATSNVLMMTWSEFGRRVQENGSQGTDHGTAAPLFVFGPGVAGGIHGDPPDLANLDPNGNLAFQTDFRSVYATVLDKWMQVDSTKVLGGSFSDLDFLK